MTAKDESEPYDGEFLIATDGRIFKAVRSDSGCVTCDLERERTEFNLRCKRLELLPDRTCVGSTRRGNLEYVFLEVKDE